LKNCIYHSSFCYQLNIFIFAGFFLANFGSYISITAKNGLAAAFFHNELVFFY